MYLQLNFYASGVLPVYVWICSKFITFVQLMANIGEENGNVLQYSCLGYPMIRGDQQATVYGVAKVRYD